MHPRLKIATFTAKGAQEHPEDASKGIAAQKIQNLNFLPIPSLSKSARSMPKVNLGKE